MSKEIEISYNNIDILELKEKMKSCGLKCLRERRLLRRRRFRLNNDIDKRNRFIRVRDEGDKITMAFKEVLNGDDSDIIEHEITISDYNTAIKILEGLDLIEEPIMEKYREDWGDDSGNINISIDECPFLNPFVEIEGKSWEIVRNYSDLLGFDYDESFYGGDLSTFYRLQYNLTKKNIWMSLSFDMDQKVLIDLNWKGDDFAVDRDTEIIRALPKMAEEYFNLVERNRDYLKKTLPWIDNVKSVESQVDYFKNCANNEFCNKFLIFFKHKIVGEVYLQNHNKEKSEVEIGYWIAENYQRSGITEKSVKRVIDYTFDVLGVKLINLYCNVENIGSENLAKKLGFEFTGEIDKNHDDSNKYVLALS